MLIMKRFRLIALWAVAAIAAVALVGYQLMAPPPDTTAIDSQPASFAEPVSELPGVVPTEQSVLQQPTTTQTADPSSPPTGNTATNNDNPATAPSFTLFAPPKIEPAVVRQTESRDENETVRLIGFVKVDKLKALLVFNGKMRAMETGDVYRQVEVVQIDPPRVTLQRGQERWITTLFDQPIVQQETPSALRVESPQVTVGTNSGRSPFTPPHMRQSLETDQLAPSTTSRLPIVTPNRAWDSVSGNLPTPPGINDLPIPELPKIPPLPGPPKPQASR